VRAAKTGAIEVTEIIGERLVRIDETFPNRVDSPRI